MSEEELLKIINIVKNIHLDKSNIKFKKIIVFKTKIRVEVETKNSTNVITLNRKKENEE